MQPQHTQTPLSSLLGIHLKTNANAIGNGSSPVSHQTPSLFPSPPSSNTINNNNNYHHAHASVLPHVNSSNTTNNSATSANNNNALQTLVRQIQYLLLSGGGAQALAELMNKIGMESTQFCQLVAFAQQNLQQHQQQIVQPQPPQGVIPTTAAPQVSNLAVQDRTMTVKDPSPHNSPASSPRGQQSQHQHQQQSSEASKAATGAVQQGGKMSEPVTSNVIQIIRLGIKEFLESKRLEFIGKPSSFQIRTEDDENLVKISAKDIWEYLLDNYEDIQQSQYRSYILKKEAPSMFKQYSNIQVDGKVYKFEMEYDVKRGRKSAAYKRRSLERKPTTSSSGSVSSSTSLSPAETSPERPTTPAVEQKFNPNVTIITPTVPKEYLVRPISNISTSSSSTCANPPKITTPTTTAPITHANVGHIRFQQKPQLTGQEAHNLLRSHLLRFPELSLLQHAGLTGTEPQFLEQFMVYSDLYDDGKESSERAMKDHEDNMEMH